MEAHEQNTQGIREGRLEATSFAENPGASTVEGNDNTDCHSAREEEDLLPTQPTPNQVTDRDDDAAQSRESSGHCQQPQQEPDDLEAAAPSPQEDVASSTAHSSRPDNAERRRLRNLIAVLTDRLRKERARGDMLKAMVTSARAGSRRLESELMAPEREDGSESLQDLGGLEDANDGDQDGAMDLRHGRMSPHSWRSDDADACSSSFEDGELAAGDSDGKTDLVSEHVHPMAEDGKD